jgi:hypothetical protein
MPRYLSWLALAVAAGFLVVASVGFAASTVTSLAFAGLSLVGLTENELSHGAEESSDTRKSRLAAAA